MQQRSTDLLLCARAAIATNRTLSRCHVGPGCHTHIDQRGQGKRKFRREKKKFNPNEIISHSSGGRDAVEVDSLRVQNEVRIIIVFIDAKDWRPKNWDICILISIAFKKSAGCADVFRICSFFVRALQVDHDGHPLLGYIIGSRTAGVNLLYGGNAHMRKVV